MVVDRATPRRPMATARHVGLFSREIVERLSTAGIEMMLGRVSRLSEGQVLQDGRYYGSTMLTLDLRELQGHVRDSCDVATAVRLARLFQNSDAVAARVRGIAREEASRTANAAVMADGIDIRFRAEGHWLFIDADVEATVNTAQRASG